MTEQELIDKIAELEAQIAELKEQLRLYRESRYSFGIPIGDTPHD